MSWGWIAIRLFFCPLSFQPSQCWVHIVVLMLFCSMLEITMLYCIVLYVKHSCPGRSRHKRATGIRRYSTCPLHLVADYHFFEKAGRGSVSNAVSYMVRRLARLIVSVFEFPLRGFVKLKIYIYITLQSSPPPTHPTSIQTSFCLKPINDIDRTHKSQWLTTFNNV